MDRIVIEGFEELTEQQMFDMSLDHIDATRKASLCPDGGCIYGGSGCNAAPFLTPEGRIYADTKYQGMGWSTLVDRGEVPKHNEGLIYALQGAHDYAAARHGSDTERFMLTYVSRMADAAGVYKLDTTKLKVLSDSLTSTYSTPLSSKH